MSRNATETSKDSCFVLHRRVIYKSLLSEHCEMAYSPTVSFTFLPSLYCVSTRSLQISFISFAGSRNKSKTTISAICIKCLGHSNMEMACHGLHICWVWVALNFPLGSCATLISHVLYTFKPGRLTFYSWVFCFPAI